MHKKGSNFKSIFLSIIGGSKFSFLKLPLGISRHQPTATSDAENNTKNHKQHHKSQMGYVDKHRKGG